MNFLVGFTSSFCLSFMMKGKAPFSWQSSYSVIIACLLWMICRYVANVWMDRPLSCVPYLLYSDLVWLSMSIWSSVWAGEEAGWLAFPWGATKRKAPVCTSACMFLAHCGSAAPPLPRLHCFVPLCCLLSPLFSALHGCQSPAVASIGVSGLTFRCLSIFPSNFLDALFYCLLKRDNRLRYIGLSIQIM